MKQYYIYILASESGKTIYIGITNDLIRRIYEHREGLVEGFTKKYNIKKLAYYEMVNDVNIAIKREKQLKGWLRRKKDDLITN